ncbi:AAA family ATPase [Streptosporangium sp. NPDC087985]|uniref:MinD/ParA family ATP-binding protein n=1 Tax=Streptosporangium sp. NPDC087985 TaxID=3366196 RepID=UPI00382489EF
MARHDREESLEEQLAWLDAIKEQEEMPPGAVTSTTADEAVISPYPKDPWGSVPSDPDAASSPLFRTAVDSAYDPAGASVALTTSPAEAADAVGWIEAADTVSAFTLPSLPVPSAQDDDGFLAPLKPLPRQEQGDPGGHISGEFPEQEARSSYAGSDPETLSSYAGSEPEARSSYTGPEQEPSRGLFEQPQRPEKPAESSSPVLEPFKPSTPGVEGLMFGDADPGRGRSALPGTGSDRDRSAFDGADSALPSGSDRDRSAFDGADSALPGTGSDRDRSAPGAAEQEDDGSGSRDAGQDRDLPVLRTVEPFIVSESLRPAAAGPEPSRPEAAEPFRVPESFGVDRPASTLPAERSPGSFGSDSSGPPSSVRDWDTTPTPDRDTVFISEQDRLFAQDRQAPAVPSRDTTPTPDRDTSPAPSRDAAPTSEQVTPFVPGGEPAEPYQARRRQSTPSPTFSAPSRQQIPGVPRPSADSLDPESLLRGRRNGPAGGWRKLIYKASAGLIKPGESPEVRRRRELVGRARTPVATGHHRVAVLSLKGGVGKTTTTVGLGATLAQVRGDRVIAVDANPDRGTLSDKLELETSATVRDLLNERQQIRRYVDIRAFTSQAPSRLEILASDRDPSVSEAFSASDYQSVAQVLENFYSICITDCGTGLLHSAMSGVLGLADQLVLVSSPSVDGARAASATLDWLEAHHYEELVRSATVVLCSVRPRSKSTVDLDRLEAHFAARCRAVIRVPYDPHLEEGAEIDLERLQPGTRESYLRLAASVGDGFAGMQP